MDALGTERPEWKAGGRTGRLHWENTPYACLCSSESCLFWSLLDLGPQVTENGQQVRGLKQRFDKI